MSRFLCDKPSVERREFAQICYADHGLSNRSDDDRDSGTESDDEGAEIEELQKYMETIIHLDSGRRHQTHHHRVSKRPPPLQVTTTTPFQHSNRHHRHRRTTPRLSPGPPDSALPSDSDPHHSSEEELEVINSHHHKRKWAGSLDEEESEEDSTDDNLGCSVDEDRHMRRSEDRCFRDSLDEDIYLGRSVEEGRYFRNSVEEERYIKSSVVDKDRYSRRSVMDGNTKDVVLLLEEELNGLQKDGDRYIKSSEEDRCLRRSVVDEDICLRRSVVDENAKDVVLLLKEEELNSHQKDSKDVVLIQKRKWGGSVDGENSDGGDVVLMLQDCPVEFRTSPPAHAHRPKWTIPPHELCYGSVVSPRKRCRRMNTTQRPCLDFEKMQQINRVRLL
ncbi:hypothetical protein JTE90_003341 [Oedothorax gibbosus]|uniref:Uncharacterized protein n=1 Tax=Oedothorax gibbosus TaxID=931172 RepID=A0AAV6UGS4_9ARAC|nr:hypothetical protein JTE90_003341 [Oedothorax gibbosus]